MKRKTINICACIFILTGAISCHHHNESNNQFRQADREFLNKVKNDSALYSKEYWQHTEKVYDSIDRRMSARYDKVNPSSRVFDDSFRSAYLGLKQGFEAGKITKKKEQASNAYEDSLSDSVFATLGHHFEKVTSHDLVQYYSALVHHARLHRNNFSLQEKSMLKKWYKALETRRKALIESGDPPKDAVKIRFLKAEYGMLSADLR